MIGRLLERYGDDRVDAGIEAYRTHYGDVGLHLSAVYPGIIAALRVLAAGAHCFVVTSKRTVFALRIVTSLGLANWFRGVYGTEPDGSLDDKADLIAAVLRAEALDPRVTVMVGDRSHDVLGAHANAMHAIGVLWGYGSRVELEAAGADALLDTPADLGVLIP